MHLTADSNRHQQEVEASDKINWSRLNTRLLHSLKCRNVTCHCSKQESFSALNCSDLMNVDRTFTAKICCWPWRLKSVLANFCKSVSSLPCGVSTRRGQCCIDALQTGWSRPVMPHQPQHYRLLWFSCSVVTSLSLNYSQSRSLMVYCWCVGAEGCSFENV